MGDLGCTVDDANALRFSVIALICLSETVRPEPSAMVWNFIYFCLTVWLQWLYPRRAQVPQLIARVSDYSLF